MSKVYLFAVMLLAASFTGCIEGGDELEKSTSPDEEETNDEEETLEPAGEDNMSSLEKRVSDLEAIIAEYELPKVYFMEFNRNDSFSGALSNYYGPNLADDGSLMCYLYNEQKVCYLYAMMYDVNGIITIYSLEGSESDVEMNCLTIVNSDPAECYAYATQAITLEVCQLENLNQSLTIRVYDNDGNEASASYELDYFTNCGRTYEPDQIPEITFSVQEASNGTYHIEVITVSEQYDLSDFSFFLKDGSGSTYTAGYNGFGEIAMATVCGQNEYGQIDCNMSNLVTGIDETYDKNDYWILWRLDNMTADDGAEFPVRFFDNDGDDMLSVGDKFIVYGSGSGSNGPAEDGWRLDIQYDLSGDIVGSAVMM